MQQKNKILKDELWRIPEIDNDRLEYVVMLHDPLGRNDELFQVLVKTDEDGDLDEILFHDASPEDLGNIVEATIAETYPNYVLHDVVGMFRYNLIPSWARKQINQKVRELKCS